MNRVSTGIEGLDKMLYGGLIPGRPYVVTAPPGSGKSILGIHFLLEGIKNGESVIMVAVDEPPNEIKTNMAHFGWSLDRLRILDATPDIRSHSKTKTIIDVGTTLDVRDMEQVTEMRKSQQLRVMEVSIHSVQKMLKQEFQGHFKATGKRYTRVVIDSMTSLKMFGMRGEDRRILIQSFMRFLSELEATTLIITELPNPGEVETEFLLARGEIRLHKWFESNAVRRAISIERLRGSPFDDRFRPMVIGSKGIFVLADGEVSLHGQRTDGFVGHFLQDIMSEEASEFLEEIIRLWEDCEVRGIDVGDLSPRIYRVMIYLHLGRHEDVLRQSLSLLQVLRERKEKAVAKRLIER
ncbi:MAG: RAD55 family ATPase [Thermoplasmata archaeon]